MHINLFSTEYSYQKPTHHHKLLQYKKRAYQGFRPVEGYQTYIFGVPPYEHGHVSVVPSSMAIIIVEF